MGRHTQAAHDSDSTNPRGSKTKTSQPMDAAALPYKRSKVGAGAPHHLAAAAAGDSAELAEHDMT